MKKSIKNLISSIEDDFDNILVGNSTECIEGVVGNCKYMYYPRSCISNLAGGLALANNIKFDRWANSRSIVLYPSILMCEGKGWKSIIERAILNIF